MHLFTYSLGFICIATSVFAVDQKSSALQTLEEQRQKELLEASNIETEGQQYFIANWPEYAEEIEEAQDHLEEAQRLESQIEQLQKESLQK